jgi:hypothetical protein
MLAPSFDFCPRLIHIVTPKDGGVLVSTWMIRQKRHAEDGPLASLIIEPKIKS